MNADLRYYLKVGRASDLADSKEKKLYRFFETLPAALAWTTLLLVVFLSWRLPFWISLFIIAFDIYWFFKSVYLSLHLRSAFNRMRFNFKRNWLSELESLKPKAEIFQGLGWRDFYHLVILPMYREPLEIVRSTFQSLVNAEFPLDRMMVVLATEERAGEKAEAVAQAIEKEFGDKFFKFLVTRHPRNLLGEVAGKGSNETWAARQTQLEIDKLKIPYERVIVSVFDVDTIVSRGFFNCLLYYYLNSDKPLRSSFQPIPLFLNNIWEAPALARVIAFSSTFWHMMMQARPERETTFSSHSMSLAPLNEIDFWQTNVVSEDSRIFWQCFLNFNGDWRVEPLYFPVSMDANVDETFWKTMANQYRQQRRWGYGAENIPYFLFGFWKDRQGSRRIPWRKKFYWTFHILEGFHSWATNSFIIFVLGWLPTIIGQGVFTQTILSYNLPRFTRLIMTLAMVGLVTSAFISINLLPPRPPRYGRIQWLWMVLQWLLFPISIIFFGSVPALEAQTRLALGKYMGFWITPKFRRYPETKNH